MHIHFYGCHNDNCKIKIPKKKKNKWKYLPKFSIHKPRCRQFVAAAITAATAATTTLIHALLYLTKTEPRRNAECFLPFESTVCFINAVVRAQELPHHRIIRNIRRFFAEVGENHELRERTIEDMLLALPTASRSMKPTTQPREETRGRRNVNVSNTKRRGGRQTGRKSGRKMAKDSYAEDTDEDEGEDEDEYDNDDD